MAARVGLTGGIGSGKSTVAGLFADLGVAIIDADRVARSVTAPGSDALRAITDRFGPSVLQSDGGLDRKALGRLVFADTSQRQWLEELLHPLIRLEMDRQAADCAAPFCILEIPLLVETGRYREMDCVVVVHCPRATRKQRLQASRGMTPAEAERIMDQQATDEDRIAVADHVIDNDKDLATLEARVIDVHRALQQRFA